jgi:hypothetical protein
MGERDIKLTADELDAIKDEVKFRENVTLRLKAVEIGVDKFNRNIDSLKNLKGWVTAHTWAIGILFIVVGWLIVYSVR